MEAQINDDEVVEVAFRKAEALVLFDWIVRLNESEQNPPQREASEEQLFYDLEATLEAVLPEVLSRDYADFLRNAHKSLSSES